MKVVIRGLWSAYMLVMISLSCNEQVDKNKQIESPNVEIKALQQEEEEAVDEVPYFESPIVQNYVDSYELYLGEYAKAVENKDSETLLLLGPKGQELALKAHEISEDMSIEDAQKFKHYLTEKNKLIKELTLKLSE